MPANYFFLLSNPLILFCEFLQDTSKFLLLLFNDPLTLPEIYIELLVETLVFLRLPALDFKDGL
jgi:hypothetical protein